jgi:hypothetical protein
MFVLVISASKASAALRHGGRIDNPDRLLARCWVAESVRSPVEMRGIGEIIE